MSRDLLWALRLLFVKRRAYQTKRQVLDRLTGADYATSHSLPDVEHWPPLDLDTPPFYRQYSAPVRNQRHVRSVPNA